MSDLAAAQLAIDASFSDMTDEQLVQRIADGLSSIRNSIMEIARPIDEATRRGIRLDKLGLTHSTITTFQLIAQGQIEERLGTKFLSSPKIRHFRGMPIDEQRKIADGEPVVVVFGRPGGSPETRMLSVDDIPLNKMADVFVDGRVRTEPEQIARIEAWAEKQPVYEDETTETTLRFDVPLTKRAASLVSAAIKKSGKDRNAWIAELISRRFGLK